jgi:hypothetical protein
VLTSRPVIFEYISALLGSAQSYSVLLIERAVVGLLRLCLLVSETVSRRVSASKQLWDLGCEDGWLTPMP